MKRLDLSNINSGASLPLKSGSLEFIQDSYKEIIGALVLDINRDFVGTTTTINGITGYYYLNVINGVNITVVGDIWTFSDGYVYVKDEIYPFIGCSIDVSTINPVVNSFLYFKLIKTQYVGNGLNADPVTFTDGSQHNIHDIRSISLEVSATDPSGIGKLYLQSGILRKKKDNYIIGDIRIINNPQTDMFDSTGLYNPTNSSNYYYYSTYNGWAICNGQNGTIDMRGRVPVGYDPVNYPIGSTGGSKDAVLVEHDHEVVGYSGTLPLAQGGGVGMLGANTTLTTSTEGVSGVGKNMQPYIVVLYIQKVA
jgi:hypothetical protein